MINLNGITRVTFISLLTLCLATPNVYGEDAAPNSGISESAQQWQEFAKELGDAGLRIHQITDESRTPLQQGEVTQNLLWALSQAALYFAQMDPDNPDWLPFLGSSYLYLNPNPDAVYYLTRIRGSGVYRISGTRGTVRLVDLQVNKSFIGFSDHGPTLQNINFADIKIAKDGTYEIIASGTRPAGYQGNWLQLDPTVDDTFLCVRAIAYDWLHEEDATFTIQRIDKPVHQEHRTAEEINNRVRQIPGYVYKQALAMTRILEAQRVKKREANRLQDVSQFFDNQPTNKNQVYYSGDIRLEPDEALILETGIPKKCPYWSMQLMDRFYNSVDYMYHQTSLNGHTARVDPDGKARVVISHRDPGVANWLDLSGYEENIFMGRWYKCGSEIPTARKVAVADVGKYLYSGTPMVSPEQRQEMMRQRIKGAQHRRRW